MNSVLPEKLKNIGIIVIGASAGGVEALGNILASVSSPRRVPIVVVMHLSPDEKSLLPELFASKTGLLTREVEDKDPIHPGVLYFAPPNYHLLIERGEFFSLNVDEPVNFSRPSIDTFFDSTAEIFGSRALGIILSGANDDGARGLATIAAAGGMGVVMDPAQAAVATMPQRAAEECPGALVLGAEEIRNLLNEF